MFYSFFHKAQKHTVLLNMKEYYEGARTITEKELIRQKIMSDIAFQFLKIILERKVRWQKLST